MAMGCTLTISRLGSVINFNLTTIIFKAIFDSYHSDDNDRVFCSPDSDRNPWEGREPSDSVIAACRASSESEPTRTACRSGD
jgi:hypothetical protein